MRECCSSGTHCRYFWRSDARTNTIFGMKSRVHPKYKTKYHVGNWPEYERALVRRGDITLWLSADAIDAWTPRPSGRRGGQRKFSDQAIETALTLRLVFGLPLRQAEGFLRSVLSVMRVDLDTPDHTTLSRRSQHLAIEFHRVPANEPLHLIVDSSGLSFVGEGEWAAAKHGGRGPRGWKKLHLGVDGSGVIVARVLTGGSTDDAQTGLTLIEAIDSAMSRFTADGAYDTVAIYEAAVCTWRHGRCATDEDRRCVSAETPGERSRLHHSEGQGGRAPPVEEGGGLPPAGPRGKRLLPVQVDHWRPASCSTSEGPGNRSSDRVQHPEPDDRAWSTGLVCNRAVKVAGSGRFSLLSGSCTNAKSWSRTDCAQTVRNRELLVGGEFVRIRSIARSSCRGSRNHPRSSRDGVP